MYRTEWMDDRRAVGTCRRRQRVGSYSFQPIEIMTAQAHELLLLERLLAYHLGPPFRPITLRCHCLIATDHDPLSPAN